MSEKKYDDHNRFRNRTIGFRVSAEEDQQVNIAVSLSGLTKQEYIVSKLLDRQIVVQGNCKIHRAVYDRLTEVLIELQRIKSGDSIDDELTSNIELLQGLIDSLYIKKPVAVVTE